MIDESATFDPGDPVGRDSDPRGYLIEDEDGAPLPSELQHSGRVWLALREAAFAMPATHQSEVDAIATEACVRIAPILWPLLPSNDHSEVAELRQTLRNIAPLVEAAMAPATFPSQRREWLGDAQAAIRGALT